MVWLGVNPRACADPAAASSPSPPFPVAAGISRVIQNYTGLTKLSEFLVSTLAAYFVHKQVGGKIRARISAYSATDLLCGKVRNLRIKLSDSSYRGVPLGKLTLVSDRPFCYRVFKSSHRKGLQNALLVHVRGQLTEEALSKALRDNRASCFKSLKIDLPGLGPQMLSFVEPTVEFEKDRVCLKSTVVTPGGDPSTGIQIAISGTPYLDGSKIMLRNLDASSPDIVDQKQFSTFTQNLLNPLFDLARLDRKDHAFRLDAFEVLENEVSFSGNLLLAPKPRPPAEES